MTQQYAPVSAGGLDDLSAISYVREWIRDWPRFNQETWTGDGTATTHQLERAPFLSDNFFSIAVAGDPAWTWTEQFNDLAGASKTVYVDFDTGMLVSTDPFPNLALITVTKREVRYRDTAILRQLQSALYAMFPKVWAEIVDTSLALQINQWDYQLPAIFSVEPRCEIVRIEYQSLGGPQPFVLVNDYRRTGLDTVHIPWSQQPAPGSALRVTYSGPYQSLDQLETSLTELPVLFAVARLLQGDEVRRIATDSQTVIAGAAANPGGLSFQTGAQLMAEFRKRLDEMQRTLPLQGWNNTFRSRR